MCLLFYAYATVIPVTVIPAGNCTLAFTPPVFAVRAALIASRTEATVPVLS